MSRLWQIYQNALKTHPARTAAISTSSLMTLGDALAQVCVEKKGLKEYDVKRSLRFTTFGFFAAGPMFSLWYRTLARVFGGTNYATLKMVCCDQLLFAPPFLAFFLSSMEVLRGENIRHIRHKLKDDYIEVMETNYKVWPAVQAVNFTFVPVQNRVIVVNLVSILWNTYLAWMSERPDPHLVKETPVEGLNTSLPPSAHENIE